MAFTFHKATKQQAKLRLGLIGLAGSGKTYSALAIAKYLVPGGRIAVIDTERGSASLYADQFSFDVLELERHSPDAYVEAIHAAEAAGYDLVIIDSLSHAWAGKDGALETVDKIAKREGKANNFTAWRDVTPKHNALVDAMLSCKMHLIATMRSKMEYVLERDERTGKSIPRKVGLAPIQREGLDYEFTIVGDLDLSHNLIISKSRCRAIEVGGVISQPGERMATTLLTWLNEGAQAPAPASKPVEKPADKPVEFVSEPVAPASSVENGLDRAFADYLKGIETAADLTALDRVATGPAKPAKGTKEHEIAITAYKARHAALTGAA